MKLEPFSPFSRTRQLFPLMFGVFCADTIKAQIDLTTQLGFYPYPQGVYPVCIFQMG